MEHHRGPRIRTACDRCYQLKERCQRPAATSPCGRCVRLGLACETVRALRPVGRRRRREQHTESQLARPSGVGIETFVASLPGLTVQDKDSLRSLLGQPGHLGRYYLSSSASTSLPAQLLQTKLHSPDLAVLIRDVLLAFASTVQQQQQQQQDGNDTRDSPVALGHISRAMASFRTHLRVRSRADAATCHLLGGMLAFAIYSGVGVGVFKVSRYCLDTAALFARGPPSEGEESTGQSFLAMLDIMHCLLHRTEPTPLPCISLYPSPGSRSSLSGRPAVDAHLGLCVSLLPYYHRLCTISNLLVNAGSDNDDDDVVSRLHDQLAAIHRAAESWRPPDFDLLSHDGHGNLDVFQAIHLLAQARMYRLGAMLMAHRLRHPFGHGHHDRLAAAWSSEILAELETAHATTGGRPLQFVTMPFIIAAVEVTTISTTPITIAAGVEAEDGETPRDKTLRALNDHIGPPAPALKAAARQFLQRIWRERDGTPAEQKMRWFDSVHKPCPVVDSIYRDLSISSAA